MIAALVSGRLLADPERRSTKTGTSFVTAKVASDTETVVSVAAFGSVAEELAVHSKGDSIAVSGRVQLSAWAGRDGEPRAGMNLTADAVLSVYAIRRKRAAVAEAGAGAGTQRPAEPTREEFDGGDDDAWLAGGEVGR